MAAPAPPPRRGATERALAWVFTGPLGHLWSTAADLAVFGARHAAGRRRRKPG